MSEQTLNKTEAMFLGLQKASINKRKRVITNSYAIAIQRLTTTKANRFRNRKAGQSHSREDFSIKVCSKAVVLVSKQGSIASLRKINTTISRQQTKGWITRRKSSKVWSQANSSAATRTHSTRVVWRSTILVACRTPKIIWHRKNKKSKRQTCQALPRTKLIQR